MSDAEPSTMGSSDDAGQIVDEAMAGTDLVEGLFASGIEQRLARGGWEVVDEVRGGLKDMIHDECILPTHRQHGRQREGWTEK
jgi:hypothetical protein